MNRSDIRAGTLDLVAISTWCSAELDAKRLDLGPAILFYRSDFLEDSISGALSDKGKWRHLTACDESRSQDPPGSLSEASYGALIVDLKKRDRKLMGVAWESIDGRRWNRGALKSVLAQVQTSLCKGLNAGGKGAPSERVKVVLAIEAAKERTRSETGAESLVTWILGQVTHQLLEELPAENLKILGKNFKLLDPSPSPSPSPSPEEKENPQKDSPCTAPSADGGVELPPLEELDVAIWFHMTRGRKNIDESRVRVDETGDEQWAVLKTDLDGAAAAYPAVDLLGELARMAFWLKTKKKRRKTPSGMTAFVNTWLNNAQNKGGNGRGVRAGRPQSKTVYPHGATMPGEWVETDDFRKRKAAGEINPDFDPHFGGTEMDELLEKERLEREAEKP